MTRDNSEHNLVRPKVSEKDAQRLVERFYGIKAEVRELGSNQDRNFVIETKSGEKWVLRVDNEVFPQSARDAQHQAIEAYAAAGVRVPQVIAGNNGALTQVSDGHSFRLFEFMAGPSLVDDGYLAPVVRRELGELAAKSVNALAPVTHDGMNRRHQWDMRIAPEVTHDLAGAITDEVLRSRVLGVVREAELALEPLKLTLPVQTIHGDLTDDNVACELGDDARLHPYAVLDFGDIALGWRVAELAVTCSSLLHHEPSRPLNVIDAIKAYHRVAPLTNAEARAVWPLIVERAAVLVASAYNQLAIDTANAYAADRIAGELAIFEAATSISVAEGVASVLAALDLLPKHETASIAPAELIHGLHQAATLDIGVESELLNGGRWLDAGVETDLLNTALEQQPLVVIPYGSYALTRAAVNTRDAAKTYTLQTVIALRAGHKSMEVSAPLTGSVLALTPNGIELSTDAGIVSIGGITPSVTLGEKVDRAAKLGTVTGGSTPSKITVQTRQPDLAVPVPAAVAPELAPAWRYLAPDPSVILGLTSNAHVDEAEAEQQRRNEVFASAQERYYEEPPQVERGWRHYLADTTGKVYVDMVNNVTGLGHGHPKVADAINKQIRVLNTNSRFLYRELAEYSERLLELAPKGGEFDTVLLVNSGSEAVDLAIKLARAATGNKKVVALREAYHGWTMASDAVTTSAFDNPYAMSNRPDWVHIADVPNIYRGTYTGSDAGAKYVADLSADLEALAKNGQSIAGFICESVLGNAGGVLLPEGYLTGAYETIRAHGGLCIADEVQVGFGRMGDTFWGVEQSGAVPDIITIAKPMGNGYPIGGVITSKKIADSLATEGNFFSSAGGSPVSCAVGIAVLDAMRDEGLQENAHEVGTHLKSRLEALGSKHDLIGPIHGHGLYLGVELVRNRETLEPAAAEAAAICERMRELGVVVLTTSERKNVLKVKPPLCLTRESADYFVDALDEVLATGW